MNGPQTAPQSAAPQSAEAIRVWVEPGYDYGRFGAWMLDWPGCFTWGTSRAETLEAVPEVVRRHLTWLRSHGEVPEEPSGGFASQMEVVEEVSVIRGDSYELNATFAADDHAVTQEELERAVGRLGFAREDLLSLAARVDAAEPEGTSMAMEDADEARETAGAAAPRRVHEILDHVGGTEIWLASRLDRSLRYEGPSRSADLAAFLEATNAWTLDRIRELHARDAALKGTDGRGETWTLAKVLRRLIYHSLDHVDELDRRLAPNPSVGVTFRS